MHNKQIKVVIDYEFWKMTNYIATVKIKIDPQKHIDSKYYGSKKSIEAGKSAA